MVNWRPVCQCFPIYMRRLKRCWNSILWEAKVPVIVCSRLQYTRRIFASPGSCATLIRHYFPHTWSNSCGVCLSWVCQNSQSVCKGPQTIRPTSFAKSDFPLEISTIWSMLSPHDTGEALFGQIKKEKKRLALFRGLGERGESIDPPPPPPCPPTPSGGWKPSQADFIALDASCVEGGYFLFYLSEENTSPKDFHVISTTLVCHGSDFSSVYNSQINRYARPTLPSSRRTLKQFYVRLPSLSRLFTCLLPSPRVFPSGTCEEIQIYSVSLQRECILK